MIQECTKVLSYLVQVVPDRGKLGDSCLEDCLVEFDGIDTLILILDFHFQDLTFVVQFLNLTGVIQVLNVHREYE